MNTALKIIMAALALLVLAGGGYAAYRYYGRGPAAPLVSEADLKALAEPAALDVPDLDLSLSGLKTIEAPELPAVPEMDLGLGTSTDLDIATSLAAELDLTVATPTIEVGLSADDIVIDAGALAKPAPVPPSPGNEAQPGDGQVPDGVQVDCAQFAAVPSCSYVTGDARALCEQCK